MDKLLLHLQSTRNNSNKLIYLTNSGTNGGETEDMIDVNKPLWDQTTYIGRWKHFAFLTDFRTIFASHEELCNAKKLCEDYKMSKEQHTFEKEDIIRAKKLKDSAFHPDTGELMPLIGRMSFQLPGGLIIATAMLTFYKSTIGIVGSQLINQAYNALVNYTNRNAKSDSVHDVHFVKHAFMFATVTSCAAALTFRRLLACRGPVIERWVPFYAVAIGNMVNLPIMRQREILRGIPISPKDREDYTIMNSSVAGVKAVSECTLTRIIMAAPGMMIIPIITNKIKPYCFYQARPWIRFPIELGLTSLFLLLMIPSALAIFPQRNSMDPYLMRLYPKEYSLFEERTKDQGHLNRVYYNKGL